MTSQQVPAILLGTGSWGGNAAISTPEHVQTYLDVLKHHDLKTIDASRDYSAGGVPGTSEFLIGSIKPASQGFIIDSKANNCSLGDHKYDKVVASVDKELSSLQTDKVHVEYIHSPDRTVPLAEPLYAMNEKYKEGKFDKFGISNYSATEVEQIIDIRENEGYIKPTVHQGQYNALYRRGEKQLFPILRKHRFSFVACSPAACGMAKKDSTMRVIMDIWAAMVHTFYGDDKTGGVQDLSGQHNVSEYDLCIRWIMYHSRIDGAKGDGVVLGATKPEQLEDTLSRIIQPGPLDDGVVKKIDEIWKAFEEDSPSYSPWVGTDEVKLVM